MGINLEKSPDPQIPIMLHFFNMPFVYTINKFRVGNTIYRTANLNPERISAESGRYQTVYSPSHRCFPKNYENAEHPGDFSQRSDLEGRPGPVAEQRRPF